MTSKEFKDSSCLHIDIKPKTQTVNLTIEVTNDRLKKWPWELIINSNSVTIVQLHHPYTIYFPNITLLPNAFSSLYWNSYQSLTLRLQCKSSNSLSIKSNVSDVNNEIKDVKFLFKCTRCDLSLMKNDIIFKRILPLPFDNSSEVFFDWFCHGSNKQFSKHMFPSEEDCFIQTNRIIVHKKVISPIAVRFKNESVFCKRCFSVVGHAAKESVQLLAYSVSAEPTIPLFTHFRKYSKPEIFFAHLFRNKLKNGLRFIISAEFVDHYSLVVVVLDEYAYRLEVPLVKSEPHHFDNVMWLLYSHPQHLDLIDWIQDPTVAHICLPLTQVLLLHKCLIDSSHRIPRSMILAGDFYVGYLLQEIE